MWEGILGKDVRMEQPEDTSCKQSYCYHHDDDNAPSRKSRCGLHSSTSFSPLLFSCNYSGQPLNPVYKQLLIWDRINSGYGRNTRERFRQRYYNRCGKKSLPLATTVCRLMLKVNSSYHI